MFFPRGLPCATNSTTTTTTFQTYIKCPTPSLINAVAFTCFSKTKNKSATKIIEHRIPKVKKELAHVELKGEKLGAKKLQRTETCGKALDCRDRL
jgi:hypothetical protein